MTREEAEAFIRSPEYERIVTDPAFTERADAMFKRLDWECLTAAECAGIVGLPFEVFRIVFAGYLAMEAMNADAPVRTLH